jgi:alkanesulfonate monooxygenase SsuD/methylene tetrahydromethanopterin reductase-like flavin-dependent oxidoreductase (luciferase family)
VGGHSKAALRRTVAFGAAWHPINRPPDEIRAGRAELERLAGAAGRSAVPAITLRNDVRMLSPGRAALPSTHAGRPLTGDPAAVIDQIRELAECGVEHLVLEFLSEDGAALDEQMRVFADRVRPAFA